ncbi:MAG TPA: hypothetical protein VIK99_10230, partial [Thermaerobacter sp.]
LYRIGRLEPMTDGHIGSAPHWFQARGQPWQVVRTYRARLARRLRPRDALGGDVTMTVMAVGADVESASILTLSALQPWPRIDALLQAWPAGAKGIFVGRRTFARARLAAGDRHFWRSCPVGGPIGFAVWTPAGWRIPARRAWLWAFEQVRLGLPAEKAVRWLAAARDERDLRALKVMAVLASA